MKPTLPSAAAVQQEKMQQQAAQIERLKQSLSEAEGALEEAGEHEKEWREAHAMLTGKFENSWVLTHPDGVPDTELGKAAMARNKELDRLQKIEAAALAMMHAGYTLPSSLFRELKERELAFAAAPTTVSTTNGENPAT